MPQPEKGDPLPGFYKAAFLDNWKIFFNPKNVTTLVFVIAVVCFKFFLAKAACCFNLISYYIIWGWLLGFYINIIYETAFEIDELPQIYIGTWMTFIWYAVKPLTIFLYTMFIAQLPFIIALSFLRDKGITQQNMWQQREGFYLLLQTLFIAGLFLFPIAILTTAIGKDLTLLRPDYLARPISKAFIPYIIVVAALTAASYLEMQTQQFNAEFSAKTNAQLLGYNLAVQIVIIIAMRTIGLFYRHYNCHFKW